MIYRILSLQLILAALVAVLVMPVTVMAGGDASGNILIRPDVGNLARLKLRPDTVITRNGNPAKMADLHTGDKVQAKYDSKNWVSELHATGS